MLSIFHRAGRRLSLAGVLCAAMATGPAWAAWSPELPESVEPQVLLITDESLAESWQDFAIFKTKLGRPTTIVTVQEIAGGYEGVDTQAKIRACVLDYVENHGTRFIILGGDSSPGTGPEDGTGLVPDRDTIHREMRYRDIPTDLYYLSPGDNDWDADDDGVYGEWDDDMDAVQYSHPSGACIGRIPVRTAQDVAAYTDKVIDYETDYPTADFAEGIIYTNTTHGSEPKVRRSWDDYLSEAWEHGEVFRFYHTETAWDEESKGDYAINAEHWLEVINNRTAGKMHMHGHGLLPLWALEHPTGNTRVNAGTVDQLTNENAYLVMTTVSCFTGQYDGEQDPCITESMLRAPDRGAVVIVAPSREGVPVFHNPREDFRLMVTEGKLDGTTESMTRFWINGLSAMEDGGYRTAGQAFIAMKEEMESHARQTAGYHWCQCELSFLGDPTLDLRAKDPASVDETHAQAIDRTFELVGMNPMYGENVSVTIHTGIMDSPGTSVTVRKDADVYQVVEVDADGVAKIERMVFHEPGEVSLSVTGPSVNAFVRSYRIGE